MSKKYIYKNYVVTLKSYICLIREYFRILCKSIDHIQSNKEIRGEDKRDTYGIENPMLTAKEVPLYGGHNRGVIKHGFSFNTRSYRKITSP